MTKQEYEQFIEDCYVTIERNMPTPSTRNYDPLFAVRAKPQSEWTTEEAAAVAADQRASLNRSTATPGP